MREQANAFRELRTCLLALGAGKNFVTLVAPVSEGCGGSFVARNLAAAFAFDDAKSALLIDCDARKPPQEQAFGIEATLGGLVDYLRDDSVDIPQVLYRTGIPRLRLLPSGQRREVTGEIFTSQRMHSMIRSMQERYHDRYLILDAPSVLDITTMDEIVEESLGQRPLAMQLLAAFAILAHCFTCSKNSVAAVRISLAPCVRQSCSTSATSC